MTYERAELRTYHSLQKCMDRSCLNWVGLCDRTGMLTTLPADERTVWILYIGAQTAFAVRAGGGCYGVTEMHSWLKLLIDGVLPSRQMEIANYFVFQFQHGMFIAIRIFSVALLSPGVGSVCYYRRPTPQSDVQQEFQGHGGPCSQYGIVLYGPQASARPSLHARVSRRFSAVAIVVLVLVLALILGRILALVLVIFRFLVFVLVLALILVLVLVGLALVDIGVVVIGVIVASFSKCTTFSPSPFK